MNPFYADYLHRFHTLYEDVEKSLEGLPPEALDWQPAPEMNSLAVLIVHLTGSTRYWVGDMAMGDPSNRNREAEFHVEGLESDVLVKRLRDTEDYVRKAFESLSLEDLNKTRISQDGGRQYTVASALLHTLEHTGLHTGHIQLTRQLWLQKVSG